MCITVLHALSDARQIEGRSPIELRKHYADYFQSQHVQALLAVHFWPTTRRAAAILWTLQATGDFAVTQAVDFGTAPLTDSPEAGADFSCAMEAPALPAVPEGMWTV